MQIGDSSFAGLRPAVPTGGRRSPSRPRDSARSAMRERRADAGRRISAGTPTGSVTRRQGNADLWSAQPAEGGRREGPRLQGWFTPRPGPRRDASSGRTPFAALRAAVPTGGRRSPSRPRDSSRLAKRGFAAVRLAWRSVVGAGFRAHARGRSETGAPGAALLGRVSRSRAMPVGDRRSMGGVVGAGFALPRDAGRRPALQGAASVGRVSRCRAMPVGDRRSRGRRRWGGFRAHARSWGGVVGAGFALPRDAGRRPALQVSLRFNANLRARKKHLAANLWFAAGDFGGKCERGDSPLSQDGAGATGFGVTRSAGFALPRDAGRRPALLP